jgi:uncharacterized membrane protein
MSQLTDSRATTTGALTSRRTVASFATYADASRAVDYLSDHKFPVERVAIVGHNLRLVEQVTGRRTKGRAALEGAMVGALIGAFFGFLFGLFDWVDPLVSGLLLALYGFVFGAITGAILGFLFHWATGGIRDFDSVPAFVADRYDVIADPEVADDAARLLDHYGDTAR